MRTRIAAQILVVSACLFCLGCAKEDTPSLQYEDVSSIKNALQESTPIEFQKELRSLFAADDEISDDFPDQSVVIAAKWRRLLDSSFGYQRISKEKLAGFLLDLNAELGTTEIPEWWEDAILSSDIINGQLRDLETNRDLYPDFRSLGISVKVEVDSVKVEWKEHEVVFDRVGLYEPDFGLDGSTIYVANHSMFPGPYDLFAVDSTNDQMIWTAAVWCEHEMVEYSGGHEHLAQVIVAEEKVWVFGASGSANVAYLETFGADDGRALFRFSTSYSSIGF